MTRSCIAASALLAMAALAACITATVHAAAAPAAPRASWEAGNVNVAFVITANANVMDLAGAWEVFQDTEAGDNSAFNLYTVSDDTRPLRATGGLMLVPQYSFANAPPPRVVVVGAQSGKSDAMMKWLRKQSRESDVLMSVCTGAFRLGMAGVLAGKPATTHHDFFDKFAAQFPDVKLQRGRRFVQSDPVIFTAGGLTSGIDLALHIVDLRLGRQAAQHTAEYMEYAGTDWKTESGAAAPKPAP